MQFLGFPYPVTEHPLGYFHSVTGVDLMKADLLVLLLTNPGERVMMSDYGTDLRSLVFEPNDQITAAKARQMIIDSITRWEPRLSVEAVNTAILPDEGVLHITIRFFNPEDISKIESLDLQIPGGG